MFYPICIKNPNYHPTRNGHEGRRLHLAPYIKYSLDYTMVFGTNGKGQEIQSTPVYVGRRSSSPVHMTLAMWKDVTHQQGILCDMQILGAKSYQDFSSGFHKYWSS